MAVKPGHATANTSRNWTISTSAASTGSWAFPGRTVTNQARRYFAVSDYQVLRSWSWRSNSDGLATWWEWGRAFLQNRSSALNWLEALAGRRARQSATKTPSRTLWGACDIPFKGWEHLEADRYRFRVANHNGAQAFEERRLSQLTSNAKHHTP